MALTPVQKITAAADKAEAAADVLEQIVEGDENTTVTTLGARTHPSISKWYTDTFGPQQTFITGEADRSTAQANISTTQASNAATSASNAADEKTYAEEWATNPEDSAVSVAAGGNGSTTFSSLHHSAKANAQRVLAETARSGAEAAESNASTSESNANTSATNASNAQTYSEEWANKAEDSLISVAAGGNGVDEYSARHWAAKAALNAHSHTNKAILDAITSSGSGSIITTAERNKLTAIENNAKDDQISSEVPYTNTTSGLTASDVQAALDEIDSNFDTLDGTVSSINSDYISQSANTNVSAHTEWQDNFEVRLGTSSDMRLYHNATNSHILNNTGIMYLDSAVDSGQIAMRANDAGSTQRTMLSLNGNSSIDLYYAGVKKFETTSAGVNVTGDVVATGDIDATLLNGLAEGQTGVDYIPYADSSGFVGVNCVPSVRLDVQQPTDPVVRVRSTGTTVNDDAIVRAQIGGTTAKSLFHFGDNTKADMGALIFDHTLNAFLLHNNDNEHIRVESDGDVGIGKTPTANVKFDVNGPLLANTLLEKETNLTGTTPSIDASVSNVFTHTLSGNTTYTFTNPPATGLAVGFTLFLTTGASFTVTWPASVTWVTSGNVAPTLSASTLDVFSFVTYDGGTTWYGFVSGQTG